MPSEAARPSSVRVASDLYCRPARALRPRAEYTGANGMIAAAKIFGRALKRHGTEASWLEPTGTDPPRTARSRLPPAALSCSGAHTFRSRCRPVRPPITLNPDPRLTRRRTPACTHWPTGAWNLRGGCMQDQPAAACVAEVAPCPSVVKCGLHTTARARHAQKHDNDGADLAHGEPTPGSPCTRHQAQQGIPGQRGDQRFRGSQRLAGGTKITAALDDARSGAAGIPHDESRPG